MVIRDCPTARCRTTCARRSWLFVLSIETTGTQVVLDERHGNAGCAYVVEQCQSRARSGATSTRLVRRDQRDRDGGIVARLSARSFAVTRSTTAIKGTMASPVMLET